MYFTMINTGNIQIELLILIKHSGPTHAKNLPKNLQSTWCYLGDPLSIVLVAPFPNIYLQNVFFLWFSDETKHKCDFQVSKLQLAITL